MSLLSEIQSSLLDDEGNIGRVLLKLRFLAARLGSVVLEDWVKHEAEGYPTGIPVPEYRRIAVSYTGTFSGPFGSGIKNAPIPSYLIEQYASDSYSRYELTQSVSAIDRLVEGCSGGTLHINAANLILLLQGNIYEDFACNSVVGTISVASLIEIQNVVRNRILELTLRLESDVPSSKEIQLNSDPRVSKNSEAEAVGQITSQIVYGNVTHINTSGERNQITVSVARGDLRSFVSSLVEAGITREDAEVFGKIVESEPGGDRKEPFGKRAKAWIAENVKKAADGTWKTSINTAVGALTEAALRYYGLT